MNAPTGLALEYVSIEQLVPMEGNPRKNEKAIPKVAESIKRFGWTSPILARREDRVVVAGHTRLAAAKSLGADKVPVIWLDLDPVSSRLYNLADNKLNEIADWDDDALVAMVRELSEEDAEGLAIAGFGDDELAKLLAEVGEAPLPDLPEGDRPPLRQMSFVLSEEQAELVEAALARAKDSGRANGDGVNENSNGNALAFICAEFSDG